MIKAHLPEDWRSELDGYDWHQQTIGDSAASVFRLEAAGSPTLFLKLEPAGPFAEMPAEEARLRWLATMGIRCPAVRRMETRADRNWLLMTALRGTDCASLGPHYAEITVSSVANALRQLHALDVHVCPFDHRLTTRMAHARTRALAGAVDETDFDDAHLGMTAIDLFEKLAASQPKSEDLVVTHGDACLPNMILDGEEFSGFIDCARLGVADRYQDLALAARSIAYNLGAQWAEPFFLRYGVSEPDRSKLAFYPLLDEFF